MEAFINHIPQSGNLNQQQIDLIGSKANRWSLARRNILQKRERSQVRGIFIKGVVRFCYYYNKGEITHYFEEESNFVADQQRFEAQIIFSE